MNKLELKKLNSSRGFTLIEVLIASIITGVITAAAFQFYVRIHSQSEAQHELSEAQHLARASLHEIKRTLRMAGYKLPAGHDPFTVSGDTLVVYMQGTQPVDTIVFHLEEFTDLEYSAVSNLPDGQQLWKLMKQTNSDQPQIFADYLTGIRYTQLSVSSLQVSLQVQTAREDLSRDVSSGSVQVDGDGTTNFKTVLLTERIKIRNVS